MSEQKLSHEVKGMACRAERQDSVETDLGKTTKKFCCVEGSQEQLASIILNGWSLKQSGLLLDLASWTNWAIEGEGSWLKRWSRHWWSLWLSSMILYRDGRNLQKDKHHCDTSPILMAKWPNSNFSVKIHETLIGIYKNTPQITLRLWKKQRFSGLMNLNSLFMSEGNQAPLITCIIPSQRWSMVAAASCSGGVFQRQGLGKWSEKTESWMHLNTEIFLMKTYFRELRTSDWAESSPSNMTITLRTQPRQCRSGLGTTLWTSLSGPARAGTWNQSDIFGETYKWLSTDGPQPTWQRWSKEKNGKKNKKCECAKLAASYPKRPEAVIVTKVL